MSSLGDRTKQKNYRRRLVSGVAVLKIEAPILPLVEALLAAGRLTHEQALNRAEVEREVAAIVEAWRKEWAALC